MPSPQSSRSENVGWQTSLSFQPGSDQPVDWARDSLPAIDELCVVTRSLHGTIEAWRCEVSSADREQVACRVALGHAARTLNLRPELFAEWLSRATDPSGDPADPGHQQRFVDYGLLVDSGTPEHPAGPTRLYGFLGESMLQELLRHTDRGLGVPILFDGHDWSTLDHGGDQLAIYRTDGALVFRLWESKALRSTHKTASSVVGVAADQLDVHAAQYLARFAVTMSKTVQDPALAEFVALLPELWSDNDPRAGVGIAVASHSVPATQECFEQLEARFDLPDANKSGQLTLVGDLKAFGDLVCEFLWKGAGLWKGH